MSMSGKMLKNGESGFSLIEILVATTILIIIVMMMSTIFHQSSIAWDAGVRKAQGNMAGRAVIGIISREMMSAVADTNLWKNGHILISQGPKEAITFVTLVASDTNRTYRMLRKISYSIGGSKSLSRTCYEMDADGAFIPVGTSMLVTNLASAEDGGLLFITPGSYEESAMILPEYVQVQLKLHKSADISSVGARSWGPNRKPDVESDPADDDIRSY